MKEMQKNMKINNFQSQGNVFLAPMAGVTDLPFRVMCKKHGVAMVYTEMINSKALCFHDVNTKKMLEVHEEEGDVAVQIFGNDPDYMGEAAAILDSLNRFKVMDINMGCPAPKIVKNKEGSALMRDPETASKIIKAVKNNTKLPVTVKIRKGWDENNINAVEFAKMIEDSGADLVTIHGRTREQYYAGNADWDIIKKVKESVKIPVIGNGDVFSVEDGIKILEYTGVDGVMIGRGAQGNPFIFSQIQDYENKGEYKEITPKMKIEACLEHIDLAIRFKGEEKGVKEMRKHIGWYLKGIYGSARVKEEINHMTESTLVKEKLVDYMTYLEA